MSTELLNKPLPAADFKFQYIALSPSDPEAEACKMPQTVQWSKFIKENKTVVITGAPAAFSPTCSVSHIPGYVAHLDDLVAKNVDQIVVLTVDNPFANQAWAKNLGINDTKHIKFASDGGCKFITSLGMELNVDEGLNWSGRWAIIVKDGIVTYVGKETNPTTDVTVSSVESVLAHL
ncbi:hypothetical protein KAFR_0B02960 [Kazachstania africana CBS 2517]|uniref:Thioredoxin domain-containing protein n=1 Tax=Kazachstania africana (strain ATCC 22294 / BCRC 22015 / CBS 2517 / CECT 1963 / NBRC 1671 / NRRL Y-8276) TaxID=1071382 RepID=H2AQE2_KAZAF|nr:hypothetical protein KAFR_0B02960 [Kazachstania africana CBS 2517]CCF56592.1 hypothetical protein KAFR_0B02960 [Kazachstania africana CBS 2517]